MVATVNASTSAGVVITPDNSGVLAFQSSSATALTIDASQNSTFVGTASATKLIPTGTSVTGNGLYLPAANSLGLSTNGTNAVYIDSSQNVGIGTTSPSAKLNVNTTGANSRIAIGDTAAGTYSTMLMYGGSGKYNFQLGVQNNVNNAFEITPSTAAGGTTFSTPAMVIDSSGNLLVGCTQPTSTTIPGLQFAPSANGTQMAWATTTTSNKIVINMTNPNGQVGYILTNGSSTTYATSSDYRLKENIVPMTGALAKVVQLKPSTYKWKLDGADGQGFIAHELQVIVPDAVTGEKDAVDANGNPVYQGIDTSFLVATLTAAIQELKAINDTLTARIVALENR